jgi:cephalosporin hydroxylase
MLQEIFYENRPDVLLEMGTFRGGSALYCASIFDLIGNGRVITVDIERQPDLPSHPRIVYLNGSSTSQEIVRQIRALIKPGEKVMVALDSDHRVAHVSEELRIYSRFVTPGQYLIVEDTNVNGHPAAPNWGDPGPFAALAPFLKEHPEFTPDLHRERLKMTFNPGGWLKRIQ